MMVEPRLKVIAPEGQYYFRDRPKAPSLYSLVRLGVPRISGLHWTNSVKLSVRTELVRVPKFSGDKAKVDKWIQHMTTLQEVHGWDDEGFWGLVLQNLEKRAMERYLGAREFKDLSTVDRLLIALHCAFSNF